MRTQQDERSVAEIVGSVGLVDVVIPCYNDGEYLIEAVQSLGRARGKGAGVIIVNDGSTEARTLDVLALMRMRGFHVIDRPNGGLPAARNTGWRATSAPYVLFLDADNRVEPALLEKAAVLMDSDPGISMAYSDKREFGLREGIVEQPVVDVPMMLVGNRIDACAVVRRQVLDATGGFDEELRAGYEDWEFWLRLLALGHRFEHIAEPLFHYRVREGSLLSRAYDPDERGRILAHITARHTDLFTAHARGVITELHRIQANDQRMLIQARDVIAEAQGSAAEALRAARTVGDELALLQREREAGDADHRSTDAALAELQREKDALASDAQRLVGELDKAMHALDVHREHARALVALLQRYEARIAAMEASRWWRARRLYHKLLALVRTSSGSSRLGLRWIRRIIFLSSRKGRVIMRRIFAALFRRLYLWMEVRPVRILVGEQQLRESTIDQRDPYVQWMERHFPRESDLRGFVDDVQHFAYRPLVSVVMPVFDPPVAVLDAAIRSVVSQAYPHWELCIADDRSTDPNVRHCLAHWMEQDARIRVVYREENGHISAASNSALAIAEGEFAAFMDHDDLLAPDALYHVVKLLNRDRSLDAIYTDEDKIDEEGHHSEPHFKPQWCPDHLLSRNYFGHLVVLRTSMVKDLGGLREGFEGSQDYDLLLRFTERTQRVGTVPRVLYHWRRHAGSLAGNEEAKPYAFHAARRALTESLERRGEPGDVSFLDGFRGYGVRFTSPLRGKVSVIIPTKDKADVLGTCLRSLFTLTEHPDFEVIVVSNNSRERSLFQLLEKMTAEQPGRFKWFEHNVPFNFSVLMNEGVKHASGDHILYLNNDTQVIHADWIRAMHEWSQRPSIGAVGVKLLYHNDLVQHAGVIIGMGGVAGHAFTGVHKDGPGYFNYVNTINNYSAVTAACMMVGRSKLESIGGWEEALAVEYNDVDLGLRLREKGLNNVYLPHVSLYHYESLTRGHPHFIKEGYAQHLHDVRFFSARWKDYIADDPCFNPNLSRGSQDFQFTR